jgi:hypothetical protein
VLAAPILEAQISDRCQPGWSLLNQLREQLTPETPTGTVQLLQARIERYLNSCRDIPDLWYYRALVDERLGGPRNIRDAAYARTQARDGLSELLTANVNPFTAKHAPAVQLSSRIDRKYALVVGINDFDHAPPLHFAVNDAKSFAALLSGEQAYHFENVWSLLDQAATLTAVRTAIGRIRARAKADDLVVIYIASHGSPRENDPNGLSYILMHDTKTDGPANLYGTSLQMIDLVETLERDVQARRVALILDTCYSGGATRPDRPAGTPGKVYSADKALVGPDTAFSVAADRFEDKTASGAARVIISASRADQTSQEDDQLQHGYFTYFLLEAFKQNMGTAPLGKVFDSVQQQVAKAVHDRYGVTQTPTMKATPEGLNIVLGAPSGVAMIPARRHSSTIEGSLGSLGPPGR